MRWTSSFFFIAPPRPFVKKWTLDELLAKVDSGLKHRDFDHGRAMFGAANCFACHRFASEGGSFTGVTVMVKVCVPLLPLPPFAVPPSSRNSTVTVATPFESGAGV